MKKRLIIISLFLLLLVSLFYLLRRRDEDYLLVDRAEYLCKDNKGIVVNYLEGRKKAVQLSLSDGRDLFLFESDDHYSNKSKTITFLTEESRASLIENKEESYSGCFLMPNDSGGLSKTYISDNFLIRLPEDYRIDEDYSYQAFGPGEEIYGVKFLIPEELGEGSNLSSFDTGVSVESIEEFDKCNSSFFIYGGNKELYFTRIDAGAGNRYEERVWVIPTEDSCLAVRYLIHYSVIDNYPEGAVVEFDKEELLAQFDKIRQSLVTR